MIDKRCLIELAAHGYWSQRQRPSHVTLLDWPWVAFAKLKLTYQHIAAIRNPVVANWLSGLFDQAWRDNRIFVIFWAQLRLIHDKLLLQCVGEQRDKQSLVHHETEPSLILRQNPRGTVPSRRQYVVVVWKQEWKATNAAKAYFHLLCFALYVVSFERACFNGQNRSAT